MHETRLELYPEPEADASRTARQALPRPGERFDPRPFNKDFAITNAILASQIGSGQKLLLVKLLSLVQGAGYVRASRGWLGRILGRPPRRISDAIRALREGGYIEHEGRGPHGTVFNFLWRPEYQYFLQDKSETGLKTAQFKKVGRKQPSFWDENSPLTEKQRRQRAEKA